MKNIILPLTLFIAFSCKKNDYHQIKTDQQLQKTDSINAARTKYNDSIKVLNNANRFADLSGSHRLTYDGDAAEFSGDISMEKIGQDEYTVSGKGLSGKNSLSIDGKIKRVSEKHLNFEGKISQKIGSSSFVRTKKTTFLDEGKGNFWRLQDKVNEDGFVDYIDIYK